jgi:hypothetical protein
MNSPAEGQIDEYLQKFRQCLRNIPVGDREEIVREIRVHIRESAERPNITIAAILKRLGPPEKLASQYTQDMLIGRASRSLSPVLILRAAFLLAERGIESTIVFVLALMGYALGGVLVGTAFLKPILPQETGLWVGPYGVNLMTPPTLAASLHEHELLGRWYIPVGIAAGCFFLWLTTWGFRKFLRRAARRAPIFVRRRAEMQPNGA